MEHVRTLGFVDTAALTATYVLKHKKELAKSDDVLHIGVNTLDLVVGGKALPVVGQWRAAEAFLARFRGKAAPFFNGAPVALKRATIYSVAPRGRVMWHEDDIRPNLFRVHLCLIPAPGAWVYSGGDSVVLPVGFPTWIDHRVLNSEVNAGLEFTTHKMVFELEAEVEDADG